MGDPINDDFCESKIDDGDKRDDCSRFLLTIRTYIFFYTAEQFTRKGYPYTLGKWEPDERREFKNKLATRIEDEFGKARFWLRQSQERGGPAGLWCDVKIELHDYAFTPNDPRPPEQCHLVVRALKDPKPYEHKEEFSDFCEVGGVSAKSPGEINPVDMTLEAKSVLRPPCVRKRSVSDEKDAQGNPKKLTFKQDILLHEFGHYLGLEHHCQQKAKFYPALGIITDQYCANLSKSKQEDLMAVGNKFRDQHGQRFATRAKETHKYASGVPLRPFVSQDRKSRPWK